MDTTNGQGLFHDRRVRLSVLAVFILLALFLAVQTIAGFKELRYIGAGAQAGNTISVSGEGEIFAVPDLAQLSFSVIAEAATSGEAQDVAAEKMNEAIAFLRGEGIEEKDIKTTGFNVYPRYEFDTRSSVFPPIGDRELVGFEVRQSVAVKIRDTKRAGEILAGLGAIGVEEISGLSFTFDDDDALYAEARAKAIEDAKEKAEALADALDVKLVRIVSFSESGSPAPYYKYESAALGRGGADGSVTPDLPVGENQIFSSVYVVYEIR